MTAHPAALLLLLAGAAPADPVARVDGFAIDAPAVEARMAVSPGMPATAVLQDLVNDAVMAAEAERLGYRKDPRVVTAVERERRRLAADAYLSRSLQGAEKVDEPSLRALYHEQADSVRIRMIVVASTEEAAKIRARLAAGGDPAAESKASLDPAWKSGEAQWRSRAQLDPAIQGIAFGAALGRWTEPVTLPLGVAILQVVERSLGTEKDFAQKREMLARFAGEQLRAHARQQLIARLRREAGATVDEPFVESTGKRLEATPEEAAHAVARVRGRPISYGEVLPEIQRLARGKEGGHFSGPTVKLEVIRHAVDQRVVEDAAMAAGGGADRSPALDALRRDEMVRAYAADLRAGAGKPSAQEIERYYGKNQGRFLRPGSRTCSHVLARSKDLAALALERLRGGQAFEDVARDLSADGPSAARGGLLGEISDEQLAAIGKEEPDLAAAIRAAKPGQAAGPVRSHSGWHVLRCSGYRPAAPVPLGEVSGVIGQLLERQRGDDAVRACIARLRTKAKVSIDEAALQRVASRH